MGLDKGRAFNAHEANESFQKQKEREAKAGLLINWSHPIKN